MEKFKDYLLRKRAELGLNQTEFAKMIGYSLPSLQKWENGQEPKEVTKIRIRTILEEK